MRGKRSIELGSQELAARAVLLVREMRADLKIGDIAEALRTRFDLRRATSYRLTIVCLDALGRHAEPREYFGGTAKTPEQKRAAAQRMCELWRKPWFRAKVKSGIERAAAKRGNAGVAA